MFSVALSNATRFPLKDDSGWKGLIMTLLICGNIPNANRLCSFCIENQVKQLQGSTQTKALEVFSLFPLKRNISFGQSVIICIIILRQFWRAAIKLKNRRFNTNNLIIYNILFFVYKRVLRLT